MSKQQIKGYTLGQGVPSDAGAKASYLDQARAKGLAVPEGRAYVLYNVEHETLQQAARDLKSHLPGGTFAVRSSFRGEDSQEQSQAGRYDSVLRVQHEDFPAALRDVFLSAGDLGGGPGGVVVQRMVEARRAGVMFIQPDFLDPVVSFTEGTAEELVGGTVAGTSLELRPDAEGDAARWRTLGREVVAAFGPGKLGWDVEWADDGTTVWVVQNRPITRAPQRDELFSYANIREIMPDPPSQFMASVVGAAGDALYQYYRDFDPDLPRSRPMIELHLGRPLFNISLLAETMRHWGLPTRLVTDQIGGADIGEAGLAPLQIARKAGPLLRQSLAQFTAVSSAKLAITELQQWKAAGSLHEMGLQTVDLFTRLVTVMLNLTAAMAVPLTLLRRFGVLAEHSAQHSTPTGRLLTALEPLRLLVQQHPEWKSTLEQGALPEDERFRGPWHDYMGGYGHRGFFESDLAEPRFVEEPSAILRSLTSPSPKVFAKSRSLLGLLSTPLWTYTRRILDVRERWRDEAMKIYLRLRRSMLEEAQSLGVEPPERIFELNLDEWAKLCSGWRPTEKFWKKRAGEREELRAYAVPDLLTRFQKRSEFLPQEGKLLGNRVDGLSLTKGTVEGVVWLATDAREIPADEVNPQETILVTRTVDPGWLFTLPRVAGVIVELGGDLSHGSILLREFGLPAITNAAGATRLFSTGDRVRLVAHDGYALKLD